MTQKLVTRKHFNKIIKEFNEQYHSAEIKLKQLTHIDSNKIMKIWSNSVQKNLPGEADVID